MKIATIILSGLRNEEHFQLMTDIERIVSQCPANELDMAETFLEFKSALGAERKSIEYIRKQAPLVPIEAANIELRKAFGGLVFFIKRYDNPQLYPDKRVAVERLLIIVKHYKKLVYRNLGERRATVDNFIKDLREQCSDEITALELEEWITLLDTANKNVNLLLQQRNNRKELLRQQTNMQESRKMVNMAFRKVRTCMEAALLLNKVSDGDNLLAELNATLHYHKTVLALRRGQRKAAAKKKAATEEPLSLVAE